MNQTHNTAAQQSVPTGAPMAGNAARRAAFQSAGQLGRRFGVASTATATPTFDAPVARQEVPLAAVLKTYNIFNAA